MTSLNSAKVVFGTMVTDLVCDCWEEERPDGFVSIGSWVNAMRDFHTSGSSNDNPTSKSKVLPLDDKSLQMELTTNQDGYLWKLLLSE